MVPVVALIIHALGFWFFSATNPEDSAAVARTVADTTMILLPPPIASRRPDPPREEEVSKPTGALDSAVIRVAGARGVLPLPTPPRLRRAGNRSLPRASAPRASVGAPTEGDGAASGVFDDITWTGEVDTSAIYWEGVVDQVPELLDGPKPRYPRDLWEQRQEGVVFVLFVVDAQGNPDPFTIDVLHASDDRFAGPAVTAVLKSRYRPGRIRGIPVRVAVLQQFTFRPSH